MTIEPQLRIRSTGDGITTSAKDPARLLEAIGYLDRLDDKTQLKKYTKERYGTKLKKKSTGDAETETAYDTYEIGKVATAIELGKFEIVPTGLYGRIADEVATLFTQSDQKWIYTSGEDEETTEELEELQATINEHREAGRFNETMERWDRLSVGVNCCYIRLLWVSGHIQYEVVRPGAIHFQFPLTIEEGGETRSPLYTEIEDASTVAIELTNAEGGKSEKQWVAYIGRNDIYEWGRCVTYEANDWFPVPDLGSDTIISEYEIQGRPANPLTYLQFFYGADLVNYEYPISRLLGTASGSDENLIPTTLTLYENSIELDSSSSRNLTNAVKASAGTVAVEDPANAGLPDTLEGAVALKREQRMNWGGRDATHAVNAGTVIDNQKREQAEAYGVPGYRVVHTQTQPESGAALMIRHQPQVEYRKKRVRLNYANVIRLSELEIYYLSAFGDQGDVPDVDVSWFPGTWTPPVPPLDRIAEIKAAEDAGYIDKVEAIRMYYRFETIEEARKKLEEIQGTTLQFGAVTGTPAEKAIFRIDQQRQKAGATPAAQTPATEEDGT
jgi:hypothetical protein